MLGLLALAGVVFFRQLVVVSLCVDSRDLFPVFPERKRSWAEKKPRKVSKDLLSAIISLATTAKFSCNKEV